MATALGLQSVVATAVESTYGTAVVTDRFQEFVSHGLKTRTNVLVSDAIRGANTGVHLRRGSLRRQSTEDGGGSLVMPIFTTGLGRWFSQLTGSTAAPVQQAATTAYLQTHAWTSQAGRSMTVQTQYRDAANAEVESLTFLGTKVVSAEFSVALNQLAQVLWELDARQVKTDVAMSSPSWGTAKTFGYMDATVKIAGSAPSSLLSDVKVKIARDLETAKRGLGNAGLKSEPYDKAPPQITGQVTADFDNTAVTDFYNRFKADTPVSFELIFERDIIASTFKEKVSILVPEIRFTDGNPVQNGTEVVTVAGAFEGFWDGSSADVTISYMSTDTAI